MLWICLAFISPATGSAADSIEGGWVGQSGPQDNRATLGLAIQRTPDGSLAARFYIDLIGVYGQPLGTVHEVSSHTYAIPAAEMNLALAENELQVTGLLHDPKAAVTLRRSSELPAALAPAAFLAGPGPRWKTRLGGAIFAPASVYDGIAFVGNIDGVFSAIAVADGARVWSFAAGRPIFGEALASADGIYFVCDNGYLFRLQRATGKEIWRYDLGGARVPRVLPNPFIYDYDYRAPRPVLANGILYVGSADGSLHAVRADTGKRVWRIPGGAKIRNTATMVGSQVIVGSEAGLVRAVERSSGKVRWQFDAKAVVTESAIVGGKLIVGARDSMLYALDPADGHMLWSQYWWGSWVESPATDAGGLAYIGSGDLARVSCIDPASGRNVWRTEVRGWVLQRPLVTQTIVYAGVSGARRAASFWPPQVSALSALDRSTGRVLWQWSMPESPGTFLHGFVAAPVSAGDTVLIGGVDGTLYAFPTG
jgi:outer membrane protein assembly factor BamB